MKLLTFLGTSDYKETTYCLNERCHVTRYCPAALTHFFELDSALIVVTKDARDKHFGQLAVEIEPVTRPVPVPIPDGHSEAELWTIFAALTEQVNEGDTLIVDLTHGFRSLPFLSFLAVAYLRIAKRVDVKGVYYGAWDARDQSTNHTPVFDLTPFVTLLDWSFATDRFIETGDARNLARLMKQAEPVGSAGEAAVKIRETASALFITSPIYAAEYSQKLAVKFPEVQDELCQKIPPFGLLADRIRESYASFGAEKLLQDPSRLGQDLRIQLRMIHWYMENQHIPQGLTLAREWLVTLTAYAIDRRASILGSKARKPIEDALNACTKRDDGQSEEEIRPADLEPQVQALPFVKELVGLWRDVTMLRNPINHAFHDKSPQKPARFVESAQKLLPRLEGIAAAVLEDPSP